MPNHALFYPEWNITDPLFLIESLLYWDRLACIVPYKGFKAPLVHADQEMQKLMVEAHELFVSPIVPSEAQKLRVHKRVLAFATHRPPEWYRPENLKPERRQIFSASKFAPKTVQLLRDSGWAMPLARHAAPDVQLIHDAACNLLMGALADECSSATMPAITDDPGSFVASCNSLLADLGASNGLTRKRSKTRSRQRATVDDLGFLLDRFPYLGIREGKVNTTTLRRLLHARKDAEIDQLRQNFRLRVDEYLMKLRAAEEPEQQLIRDEFAHAIAADRELLRKELRRAGLKSLISKDGAVGGIVRAVSRTVSGAAGLIFGLGKGLLEHREKRREVLRQHWSSWVFSAGVGRFTVW